MKKIVFALMMMASVFAFTACSSDDDKGPNCVQLIQNVFDAYEAYDENPSEANQQAIDAAEAALENSNCGDELEIEVEIE